MALRRKGDEIMRRQVVVAHQAGTDGGHTEDDANRPREPGATGGRKRPNEPMQHEMTLSAAGSGKKKGCPGGYNKAVLSDISTDAASPNAEQLPPGVSDAGPGPRPCCLPCSQKGY